MDRKRIMIAFAGAMLTGCSFAPTYTMRLGISKLGEQVQCVKRSDEE
jgi:hypothetical protein